MKNNLSIGHTCTRTAILLHLKGKNIDLRKFASENGGVPG